jgi:phage-related holin
MFYQLTIISQKLSSGLRKILGNISWLFAERVLTIIVFLTVGIYVIRDLETKNFGKLSCRISFVGLSRAIASLMTI